MKFLKKDFIFQDVNKLKGVGPQLSKFLKNKKIEKVKDIILNLPYSETDRSKVSRLDNLEIGKIHTVKVQVKKLNFPRIRNLPSTIQCVDETGNINIVYFNSREGYLRKIFPLNEWVIVSGRVNFFKKNYQITNPDYVTFLNNRDYVLKNIPKYNLTKGINEKKYRSISEQVLKNLPQINDWWDENFLKKNKLYNWNKSIMELHNSQKKIIVKLIVIEELFLMKFVQISSLYLKIDKELKEEKIKRNSMEIIQKKF